MKGMVYQLRGEYKKAMDLFLEVQRLPEYELMADGYLGNLYVSMNKKAKSIAILDRLLESDKTAPETKAPFAMALICAALNKTDEVFEFLNLSVERRDNNVIYIQGYPTFHQYRSDPRYTLLMKKMGLWK